jgi:putative acyl-CoA dehydrogenase
MVTTASEASARRLVEHMALTLQASLLVRHAPPTVADAFCATRLGGDYNGTLGTVPVGTDLRSIVDRTTPQIGG